MQETVELPAALGAGSVVFDPATLRYRLAHGPDAVAGAREALQAPPPAGTIDDHVVDAPGRAWRLMVAPTMACNMTCTYCYNELPTKTVPGSASAVHAAGSDVLRRRVCEFVDSFGPGERVAVNFTGGEPLFARRQLQDLVTELRARSADRGSQLEVGLYTNGLLMTPAFVDWAMQHGITLAVSLDGPPVEHDSRRRTRGGQPTARRILRNIRHLADVSGDRPMRLRAVGQGSERSLLYYAYFVALGFSEIQLLQEYGTGGLRPRSHPDDLDAVAWYARQLTAGLVLDIAPFSWYLLRLALRDRAVQAHLPCDVAVSSFALDPAGDAYPCHHFFGQPEHAYPAGGLPTPEERSRRFVDVSRRPGCTTCVARHMCGGACYHRAASATGDYFGTVDDLCTERLSMVAPMIECFDTVLRGNRQALLDLVAGRLVRPEPVPEAYACESMDEFEHLLAELS